MRSTDPSRRLLVAVGATIGILVLAAATLAWQSAGASAPPSRAVAAAAVVAPEPPTTSSTSTTLRPTTTTAPPSTSTMVKPKPKPVATTAPRPVVPAAAPVTVPPAPAPGTSPEQRCADAQQWVAAHGLILPAGWGFRCPAKAVVDGADRWGVACWNCEGTGSWIAVDIDRIGISVATLRYVIAHETCHAIDYMGLGITTELGADLCAAVHGAPRP